MSLATASSIEHVDRRVPDQRTLLFALLLIVGAVVEFGLLALWQRNGYWDFSDGVYALSAREFLHGLVPYRDFATAQPPPVYLAGVVVLAIHDGLASIRAGMGLLDLATAALVGVSVWRLSRRRWVAVAAAAVAPLLPISLHEHAQLMPETLAAPLLLAGALCCARKERAAIGGALLAVAALCKLAFALPALAIALASTARRKAVVALLVVGAALAGLSLAAFGTGVWREAVQAQLQVGHASLHYAAGLIAQGAWNELVLVIGAGLALWIAKTDASKVGEPALAWTLAAAAVAGLVLTLTVFKRGSYINVLVVAEPPLLALASCGAVWSWQRGGTWRLVVVVLGALLAVQSVSLLTSPGNPWAAKRPGASSGLAWSAGPATIDGEVAVARRCPRSVAYAGFPYVAFLAARRMPGNQPDQFMIENAREDSGFAVRAARDQPRCPHS
jgi:hypothetical protein